LHLVPAVHSSTVTDQPAHSSNPNKEIKKEGI
jgi:hypothetical protein